MAQHKVIGTQCTVQYFNICHEQKQNKKINDLVKGKIYYLTAGIAYSNAF